MSMLRATCWCGVKAFATEGAARIHMDRVTSRGVSMELPIGVRECSVGLWHLVYGTKPKGLKAVSAKREQENRERRAMIRELWPDLDPQCIVLDCTSLADEVHEPLSRGRRGSITDPDNAVPICRLHHDEVTFGEPAWAYEQGLLIHSWESGTVAEVAEKRRALLREAS